ncbi:unnamed protein product [Porites evermanni]|uniref:Uncharacterized protein n=1 Tax=Porites evermanni TaxID=104178 RepID=A0ABN8T278_9CNID|nr:unnamed protein product [Porites evermanni]
MDRSESLLTNNCHDLEAEADLHMEDVTVKSNSVPKRPIAIDSFVKEALISTTESGHLDCGIKTSKISPNLPQFDVVHFRRNIFNLPSGGVGKHFIEELTFWLKQFNSNSDLNSVALKAFMLLPSVILQKPSATSKSKEHSVAIERRLALWSHGDLNMLMKEIRFIQDRFVNSKRARSVEDILITFAKLFFQGKLTAAIKLLDKENSSGLLNLSDEVSAQLKEKHPVPAEIEEECLLHGPVDLVPPGIFDLINEQRIFDSALKTKGSAGPSGVDAELYRFKSKFTYYLRTIESFEEYVDPIEEVIHTSFLPSLFGRAEPLPEELKDLVSLSPAQGGIGIPDLKRESHWRSSMNRLI